MQQYLIGVDIGTQGTKAALLDETLQVVCTAFEASCLISPKPGVVWQEADAIYGACVRTVRSLMEQCPDAKQCLQAIGIDSQMAGIMGIGADGEAVTEYDSWLDSRSTMYIDAMERTAGEEILLRSGSPVTGNHATKMLWWKEHEPEQYRKISKFVLPHAYVAGKMAGNTAEQAGFDYTCLHFNSFSDNAQKSWNEPMLRTFGVDPEKMPRIVSPFDIIGGVSKEFSALTGVPSGVPLVAGLGDSAASTFGCGMFTQGKVLDCAGTASILCGVVNQYVPDTANRTMVMMRSPLEGLWLPLSYIGGGGLCIRWVRDSFSGSPALSYDALEREALCVAPGSDGLLFCPHFSGRVLPPEPSQKGAYVGLQFSHTRAHFYRAAMEGIAQEYKIYLGILHGLFNNEFSRISAVGGGARSDLFNQIKADILGVPVDVYDTGETALTGSAAVAGMGVGLIENYAQKINDALHLRRTFLPDDTLASCYETQSLAYRAMLTMLRT